VITNVVTLDYPNGREKFHSSKWKGKRLRDG